MGRYLDLLRTLRQQTTATTDPRSDSEPLSERPEDGAKKAKKAKKASERGIPCEESPPSLRKKSLPSEEAILAAVRRHPGLFLWQQLAAADIPFGTEVEQEAVLQAVASLLARGLLRRAGVTTSEPVSLWMKVATAEPRGVSHGETPAG